MKKIYILLALMGLICLRANAQWTAYFDGPVNGNDIGSFIAADGQNNIIIGGYTSSNGLGTDFAVIKYSASGNFLWSYIYTNPHNGENRPYGIIVDQLNNIYITGGSIGNNSYDFCTIKLNGAGQNQWVRTFDGPGSGEDRSYGIIVDQQNNVIITGSSYSGPGQGFDIRTIKYNSSGSQLWVNTYSGSGEDRPYGIIVDQQDNIIITGSAFSPSSGNIDYITMKLTPAGDELWTSMYNGTGNSEDRSYGIIVDNNNNIYITGASSGAGSGFDYLTIGYYPDGTNKFSPQRYNGTGNSEDISNSITLTTNNEIVITGSSRSGSVEGTEDAVTIKYEENGVEKWQKRYNGTGGSADIAYKIVTPQNSNSFVSALGYTTTAGEKDIMILSYSNTGNLIGSSIINGPGNDNDIAYSGVSLSNDLVFTGFVTNTSGNTDIIISEIPASQLTGKIRSDNIPADYKLFQNYPNPFNPVTKIRLDIPKASKVNLSVYNQFGQLVKTFINNDLAEGEYEFTFQANDLSSGIYFCKLSSGNFSRTTKMILIK